MGEHKTEAISEAQFELDLSIINIKGPFPELVDEPEKAFPKNFEQMLEASELVLDFLYHPDLSDHLSILCKAKDIPLIASGRRVIGAECPATCCTLARNKRFGKYGELFGAPELIVTLDETEKLSSVRAKRQASCGATLKAAQKIVGFSPKDALQKYGLEVQFFCKAKTKPGLFLKNPIHVAAEIHTAALELALDSTIKKAVIKTPGQDWNQPGGGKENV
ncbi:MAG: hypothetical protein GXP49_04300 [Deltaproteobacteria bacterium]|nr:hypothetical protein [Deltaproteobacteria bacterium]